MGLEEQHGAARALGARPCLRQRASVLARETPLPRRHNEIVPWAVDELGISGEFAVLAYDIARQEGLEPALLFELVRCGVAIREADTPDVPSLEPTPPEWLQRAPDPAAARREWRLRASARRLRALVEDRGSASAGLEAFASLDDVEEVAY
ncbi:MAG: hypothetical protein ACRELD_08105 [Longimicrobiales bacterium]